MTNKLTRDKIIKLIVLAVVVFFVYSGITYIIFQEGTGVGFYVNLAAIVILLSFVMVLFERLAVIDLLKINDLKNDYESKIAVLSEKNRELERQVASFEKKVSKRIGILSKEAEMKKLIAEFVNHSDKPTRLLSYMVDTFQALAAVLYIQNEPEGEFVVKEHFGLLDDFVPANFSRGEGLNGQVAAAEKPQQIEDIPEDYFNLTSGLGKAKPKFLYLLPIMKDEHCFALIELASFEKQDLELIWEDITTKKDKKQ